MYVVQHTNMKECFNMNSRWPDGCKVNCTNMASGCEQYIYWNVTMETALKCWHVPCIAAPSCTKL